MARPPLCILLTVGAIALSVVTATAAARAERPDPATIAGALRSVVSVLPQWAGRPPSPDEPEGSGVVVGDGTLILTADHVLGDPLSILVRTPTGKVLRAEVARRDQATDLALLVIGEKLPAFAFGEPVLPGEEVCAIGNAFGLGPSVACGTVSASGRSGVGFNAIEDFVQTDTAVNPGMSGGALIAGDGRLAGVLSAIFTKQSDANIGVNFAVSAALAEAVLKRLTAPVAVPWPRLGATLRPHPPRGEPGQVGAEVVAVAPGSLAAEAGLAPGDIVLEAGDRRVSGGEAVAAALALMPAGRSLRLTLLRDGNRLTLEVPVAE
ncbi:MAG: S1C family serine protease [Propylenella sp.]